MRISFLFYFMVIGGTTTLLSQRYINVNSQVNVSQSTTTVVNANYGLSMIAREVAAFRNSWENKRKRAEALAKATSQLSMIKSTYDNAASYPDQIIDGWHLVMATDNYNYCSPAKVFIQDNQIKEFVVGNWKKLSRPFEVLSPINQGKALITLDFNGNTDTLELYFINDLSKPTTVEEPLNSAFISFWSDLRKAKSIKIWLDNDYFGELSHRYESQPPCYGEGTITIEVKPGRYFYKGAGRGTIAWEGYVEAKEDQCLSYLLNKENKR